MTTEDQARMAREMTTRAEKAQITNEKLMGRFTIGVEKLAQSVTDIKQFGIQEAQRRLLGKLDQFAPSIDTAAKAIDKFAVEAKTGNVNTTQLIEELKKLISGQAVQANAIMAALRSRGNMTTAERDAYKQFMATIGLSGVAQ